MSKNKNFTIHKKNFKIIYEAEESQSSFEPS